MAKNHQGKDRDIEEKGRESNAELEWAKYNKKWGHYWRNF